MTLILAGLIILCLLCVCVIAYLAVALNAAQRGRDAKAQEGAAAERASVVSSPEGGGGIAHETPDEAKDAAGSTATETEARPTPAGPETENVDAAGAGTDATANASTSDEEAGVYSFAWSMDVFFNRTSFPKELLLNESFHRGVQLFASQDYTPQDLVNFSRGSNIVIACMALEALAARTDAHAVAPQIVFNLNDYYYWPRYFALRAIHAAHAATASPIVTDVLARLNNTWREFVPLQSLREFVEMRAQAGDRVSADELLARISGGTYTDEMIEELAKLVDELGDDLPAEVGHGLRRWRDERVDLQFLKSFGRVWDDARAQETRDTSTESVAARLAELESAFRKDPPRSVLVVGDAGVGKTTLVRAFARRLQRERWTIFEASASDVISGQKYIGELEGRVQRLLREIGGRRVLWVVPNFQEMLWAGRHEYNPVGILDLLLPHIESGALKLIGETPSAAYEQMMRLRPKLKTVMQTCRVEPMDDAETLELARAWAHTPAEDGTGQPPRINEQTLREAFQLARQYLGDKAAPGNLMQFLDATYQRLLVERGAGSAPVNITLDDLLVTLSQLTGVPVEILDEREELNLTTLRSFFEQRVLGQPEAVECLVERVAMIKAGLTDPTRPQGVFLFVGPTGTGKTEIAKTLAEFLFGSPERMIRLDMSEFQTADTLDRILGEASEAREAQALVHLIRKQPFSVVLLDEFEKAHPQVWDLFLQVFDDGRLTDRRGNTADFRHSVIIMTSNLGATLPTGASIGFAQEQAQFAAASVERAVMKSFRREFVNRIDRIVVFRPLGLGVMRDLLRKELGDVLTRRGLRTRQWAVEWDDSAIEFLLQKGFTADLGARPLKRAIERYLLSPLAMTIVNHQFPEGDQFLFVRSSSGGESLEVQFVDPDAPTPTGAMDEEAGAHGSAPVVEEEFDESVAREHLRLEIIASDARGAAEEVWLLQQKFEELTERTEADEWQQRKARALEQTQKSGFWNSPERFSVLGLAEYMDRIEAGLDTAGSLLARLRGSSERRERRVLPPELVGRVAEQLYLIDAACRGLDAGEARDAFLSLHASREPGTDAEVCDEFARRLAAMYRRWAEKRRMRFRILEESGANVASADGDRGTGEYRVLMAVSGFGAYTILRPEAGLHVLETPQDEKSFNRARVLVRVLAQPEEPAGHGPDALRAQALRTLAADDQTPPGIVRSYREEPSPLVRDRVRGWRTGKLERVLGGDFDLLSDR